MGYVSRGVLIALITCTSGTATSQPLTGTLQRCLSAEAEREALSGSILVTEGGRPVAAVYRGKQAEASSTPIGPDTRFNLGSASKMFTAVAIGQLIEHGKLQLDEPVGQIVAGLTREASKVTIRELLTHTSGLGDFFRPENMSAMLKARSASDILPLIASDKPAYAPGAKFSYSNSGFALLGIVIERLSGMSYGEYLQRNVFGRAGMTRTGLHPKPLATLAVGMTAGGMQMPGHADAHLVLIGRDGKPLPIGSQAPGASGLTLIDPGGAKLGASTADAGQLRPAPGATEGYGSPAGGLFSTAQDMDRFAAGLMDGKLLRPSTVAEFTSPQAESAPATAERPARHYGFGFGLTEDNGVAWFGHNGGTLGANAEFAVQPNHHWVISVLSNRDPPTASKVMAWTRATLADANRLSTCFEPQVGSH